jgi:hypothetical protein
MKKNLAFEGMDKVLNGDHVLCIAWARNQTGDVIRGAARLTLICEEITRLSVTFPKVW